jgi:galactonate dehydratase
MRITKIETFIAGNPWKNWTFVKVHTDEGTYGIGEGTMNGFAKTIEACVHELSHLVVGWDPFNVEALTLHLLRDLYTDGGHIHRAAVAAIEMACLDIKGKALGVPVWQLLGGKVRDTILCYANGWYRCDCEPGPMAEAAVQTAKDGFRAMKFDPFFDVHLQMTKWDEDKSIEIVRAIRNAVGPEVELMIEGHCRFTVGQAVKIGRRLEEFDVTWFEEPCPHYRMSDTIEVARRVPVPVATGESLHAKEQFAELLQHPGVAFYQPEIMSLGGMTQARHVCAMVEAASGVVAPHNAQGPVSTVACLHLAACCNNYRIQEYFEHYNVEWEKDLVTWHPKLNVADGTLNIPTAPGLGVDLNVGEIKRHPYQPGNFLPLFAKEWNRRKGYSGGPVAS